MDVVYNPSNKASVVNYLTKRFGFDVAVNMYNDRTIPSDVMDTVRDKVLVSKPSPTPIIDWTDESILSDMKRYVQKTYPRTYKNVDIEHLTDYDIRMIHTMNKLRKSYDTHTSQRSRTVLCSINVIERDRESQIPLPRNQQKKAPKAVVVQEICRAVKMNGEKCTAKAKNGTQFCFRHSKKK